MAPSNMRPIDQLLETVRHLHDHSANLQIEVSIRDTRRPPNGRVYTLTTGIGSDHLSEGSYIPGQGGMSHEGGTVERTADPLAIALQIRDAIYGQGVWHEARAAKAQELLDQRGGTKRGKTTDEFARATSPKR